MKTDNLTVNCTAGLSSYTISVGGQSLVVCGKWAKKCLGDRAARLVVISNPLVYKLYGKLTVDELTRAGFNVSHFLMKDGEQYKNLKTLESVLKFFAETGLSRTDAVVALGGGVVGDLAGFAAAVYLRGVRFLQIPTTLLSMVDSSVGGKTGVNSAFGKNLIGAFHQPSGVLIDVNVLKTLPQRELTAGLCEMVKHAAIGGKDLLKKTISFLDEFLIPDNFKFQISNLKFPEKKNDELGIKNYQLLIDLIAANIEFKARIVAGDERESSERMDSSSRKILNFGHTLAHALEKVTGYQYLRHGEAVGYGILFAAELSKSLALIDGKVVNLLYDVVHRAGSLPPIAHLEETEVFEAFRFDKKQLSGSLQMVLLKGIGKPVIVAEKDLPSAHLRNAYKQLLRKTS